MIKYVTTIKDKRPNTKTALHCSLLKVDPDIVKCDWIYLCLAFLLLVLAVQSARITWEANHLSSFFKHSEFLVHGSESSENDLQKYLGYISKTSPQCIRQSNGFNYETISQAGFQYHHNLWYYFETFNCGHLKNATLRTTLAVFALKERKAENHR